MINYKDQADPAQVGLDEGELLPGQGGRDRRQGRDPQQDGEDERQDT